MEAVFKEAIFKEEAVFKEMGAGLIVSATLQVSVYTCLFLSLFLNIYALLQGLTN